MKQTVVDAHRRLDSSLGPWRPRLSVDSVCFIDSYKVVSNLDPKYFEPDGSVVLSLFASTVLLSVNGGQNQICASMNIMKISIVTLPHGGVLALGTPSSWG